MALLPRKPHCCVSVLQGTARVGRFLCGVIPGSPVLNRLKLVHAKGNKIILSQPKDRRRRNRWIVFIMTSRRNMATNMTIPS